VTITVHEVLLAVRPVVMAAATALIVCGVFLTAIESRANDKLYRNQIASCERGHVTRTVIHEALVIASESVSDPKAAGRFARLDATIWPLTPCVELIERP